MARANVVRHHCGRCATSAVRRSLRLSRALVYVGPSRRGRRRGPRCLGGDSAGLGGALHRSPFPASNRALDGIAVPALARPDPRRSAPARGVHNHVAVPGRPGHRRFPWGAAPRAGRSTYLPVVSAFQFVFCGVPVSTGHCNLVMTPAADSVVVLGLLDRVMDEIATRASCTVLVPQGVQRRAR